MPDGRTILKRYGDSVVATTGMRSMEAAEETETQTRVVSPFENQRRSVECVSLDEEPARMINYQNANEAAARVITSMDEAIDTMINGMGIVGR